MNIGSHGLGLSICHNISNALNANLSVDSKIGKGTTFTLRFNAQRTEPDAVFDVEHFRTKYARKQQEISSQTKQQVFLGSKLMRIREESLEQSLSEISLSQESH